MVDIPKIIGKKNYARLAKAGIASETKLRRLQPEEIMALAGIGPKTVNKLYKALNKKSVNQKELDKKYRKLKSRTKLKRIGQAFMNLTENPEPIKNAIERRRKEAHLWQNFLAYAYNFANPDKTRVSPIPYGPVDVTLNPTTMTYQKAKRRQTAIYTITKEQERFRLNLEVFDLENDEKLVENNDFIFENNYNERVGTLIMESLQDEYTQFRQKTQDGMFVVVLQTGLEELASKIRDKYENDIDNSIFAVAPNIQDYYNWEIVFKYYENPILNQIINRFDAFNEFYQYENALKYADRKIDYNQFSETNTEGWWYLVGQSKISNVIFSESKQYTAKFGVLKGMIYNFQENFSKERFESSWVIDLPETYKEFVETKKKGLMKIAGQSIPIHLLAMINFTLDKEYVVYSSYSSNTLIFQSTRFPEWGFVVAFS